MAETMALIGLATLLCCSADVYSNTEFDLTKLKQVVEGTHEQVKAPQKGSSFRVFYDYNGKRISPWHDIPLSADKLPFKNPDKIFHFICEIPKGTTPKNEVNKEYPFNPIAQDHKKGKLRSYKYKPEEGSSCNYGAIPQTWEDPNDPHPDTKFGGDNDPVDVLQINDKPCTVGDIQRVRVLGTLALIDDDETDWKLIVVDDTDPDTKELRDVSDVPKEKVDFLREWFRVYKTAEGKGENKFGLDEKAMDGEYARQVLVDTHASWKKLVEGETKCFDGKPKVECFSKYSNVRSEL